MKQLFYIFLFAYTFFSCDNQKKELRFENLEKGDTCLVNKMLLKRLDIPLGKPMPGEWLYSHKETGQNFQEYFTIKPVGPDSIRNKIYLLPIGKFTAAERKILELNREYVNLFFGLKTIQLPAISEALIPKNKRRNNFGIQQLDASYLIKNVLPSYFPKDGIVIMGITAKDLYPDPSWNYVFGLANYKMRTGVSSIFRFSDGYLSEGNYSYCLRRLIKTSTHEIGHMFSLKHCTRALCLMNGTNNLKEGDNKPNALCSECLNKLTWNLNWNGVKRFEKMILFLEKHGLQDDAKILVKQLEILNNK